MPTLEFKGKNHIYAHHLTVPYRPLIPDPSKSVSPSPSGGNLIIHGDNLHALKALLPTYAGRIKCIYIDPPYNTGNEGWIYNDKVNSPLMREWLAQNTEVDSEDLERHDKWLCMMWPRLQILRELLAEDGCIFVSIDYNEEHHLRIIMDEIFGEDGFRNTFAVARVKKNIREREQIRALNFGYNTVLFFGRSENSLIIPPTRYQEKKARWHAFDAPGIRPSMEYELFGSKPPSGRHWMYSESRAETLIEEGRLRANPRSGKPQYLLDESDRTMLDTNWTDLQEYDSKYNFPNGEKNVDLIKRILSMFDDKDAIILDSFAGSGTTGHAALEMNKEDGGNRRFILVECEDYADDITAERVRRVINGVPDARNKALRDGLGGEFTYCTLGEPISVEGMLLSDQLPAYGALASYILHCASGVATDAAYLESGRDREDGFFYESDNVRYHLFYRSDVIWLRSTKGALTYEKAKSMSESARAVGKKPVVFAPLKFISQEDLTRLGVTFCQLPYEMTASRAQALEM